MVLDAVEDQLERQVLGVVAFAKANDGSVDHPQFCKLQPCYVRRGGRWTEVSDAKTEFPDDGFVFWWQPPHEAREGTFWIVAVGSQPHYDGDRKRERFQVQPGSEAEQPLEAVSLPGISSASGLRRVLASGRVLLDSPSVGRLLVALPGARGKWIGPIGVRSTTSRGSSYEAEVDVSLRFLDVHELDHALFEEVHLGDRRHTLWKPDEPLGPATVLFNTQSDADLILSLLKRIRKYDRAAADALNVTRRTLETYLGILDSSGLLATQDALREEGRKEAAHALIEDVEGRATFMDELLNVLIEHPKVEARLDQRLAEEVERQRDLIAQRLRADLEEAELEADRLRDELAALVAQRDDAAEALASVEGRLEQAATDLIEGAVAKLSEHLVVRGLLRSVDQGARRPALSNPPVVEPAPNVREFVSVDELVTACRREALWRGVDPHVLQLGAAVLLGRRTLFFCGNLAETAAVALAEVLAGALSCTVSAAATMFGAGDLLRAPCAPLGAARVEGMVLGDFLEATADQDRLAVVIIRGANRMPLESFWPEVFEAVHRQMPVAWEDSQGRARRFVAGRKLLIIGTLATGPSIFRIPLPLARNVPLIHADRTVIDPKLLALGTRGAGPSTLSSECWGEIVGTRSEFVQRVADSAGAGEFPLAPRERAVFLGAALTVMRAEERALGEVLGTVILGRPGAEVPDAGASLPPGTLEWMRGAATEGWVAEVERLIEGEEK